MVKKGSKLPLCERDSGSYICDSKDNCHNLLGISERAGETAAAAGRLGDVGAGDLHGLGIGRHEENFQEHRRCQHGGTTELPRWSAC